MATDTQVPSWEAIRWGVDRLCEERGWHHGVPLPSSTDQYRRIVMAKGCPLADKHGHGVPFAFAHKDGVHTCSTKDVENATYLVNKWRPYPSEVSVYRDEKGAFKVRWPIAHERLKIVLDTMMTRAGAVSAESEFKAMECLLPKINESQWECYVLSGMFPETSKRSGVTYILRKGLPTLAMRMVPRPEGGEQRNFLAALCLHALAWYEGTFVGSYPPTDEVINHLMMIRGDEHGFWKKSVQHGITDPLAGI